MVASGLGVQENCLAETWAKIYRVYWGWHTGGLKPCTSGYDVGNEGEKAMKENCFPIRK
jgi:hypothetical protein